MFPIILFDPNLGQSRWFRKALKYFLSRTESENGPTQADPTTLDASIKISFLIQTLFNGRHAHNSFKSVIKSLKVINGLGFSKAEETAGVFMQTFIQMEYERTDSIIHYNHVGFDHVYGLGFRTELEPDSGLFRKIGSNFFFHMIAGLPVCQILPPTFVVDGCKVEFRTILICIVELLLDGPSKTFEIKNGLISVTDCLDATRDENLNLIKNVAVVVAHHHRLIQVFAHKCSKRPTVLCWTRELTDDFIRQALSRLRNTYDVEDNLFDKAMLYMGGAKEKLSSLKEILPQLGRVLALVISTGALAVETKFCSKEKDMKNLCRALGNLDPIQTGIWNCIKKEVSKALNTGFYIASLKFMANIEETLMSGSKNVHE